MNILITGCCGFIGYHLSQKMGTNYKVLGIDNISTYYDTNYKYKRLKKLKSNKNFKFFKIDITDKKKLEKFFAKFNIDVVINLAAQPGVRLSISNPSIYFQNNIKGFFNLIECVKKYRVKHFIFASSSSVYGNQIKYPVQENADVSKPLSFYGATKVCNEVMAYSFSNMHKIPTTCLRFFTVYGPENRPDMAMYKFTKNFISNKKIELFNKGNFLRDFTYISDIINSISKLILKPPKKIIPYNVFNIGRSKPEKVKNFVDEILKQLKYKKVKIKKVSKKNNNEPLITYSNSKSLYKFIKYKPNVNIKTGISEFIKWYRNN